jgi:hypothetical protein
MSNTAIGTIRGLEGAHEGAQVPWTEFVEVFQVADESWLTRESASVKTP